MQRVRRGVQRALPFALNAWWNPSDLGKQAPEGKNMLQKRSRQEIVAMRRPGARAEEAGSNPIQERHFNAGERRREEEEQRKIKLQLTMAIPRRCQEPCPFSIEVRT